MKINCQLSIYPFFILAVCSLFTLIGCTKNFDEINTDPNRIESISPGTLLNPLLYEMSSYYMQRSSDHTFNLMQVALPYPSPSGGLHRYDVTENAGAGIWNTSYRWLSNIREMKMAAETAGDPNYKAIALTLNAWIYSNLTDIFGDVPMSEATRGEEGIFRPVFDTQKDIYTKLLADLDSANNLFVTNRAMLFGTDLMYANNVTRWKIFCNSLHMRLLLRVSNRTETNAWTKLQEMIANPTMYPVMVSNAESAMLQITGIAPLISPWGRAIDFSTFRAAGLFFTDNLNEFNDPRLPIFCTQARTTVGNQPIGYKGIPSGYAGSDTQFDYIPSNVNNVLVTAPMRIVVMPYAEVEFIKAEVAMQAGNTAAAKTAYEAGVKAAIEQWGATMPSTYFANAAAAFNNTKEQLMLQKYYALYFVDYQQWFEYRRTGLPVLPKAGGMLNDQNVPRRFFYPINIRSINATNYQAAVAKMGGDNINIKAWWEN